MADSSHPPSAIGYLPGSPLLAALSDNPQRPLSEVNIFQFDVNGLADAQSTSVDQLKENPVSALGSLFTPESGKKGLDLGHEKRFRQALAHLGSGDARRRIFLDLPLRQKEAEEPLYDQHMIANRLSGQASPLEAGHIIWQLGSGDLPQR